MIVEIIPAVGQQPIVLVAAQVVVRNEDGTPVAAAATYGPDDTIAVTHVKDKDFNQMLRNLGVNMTVIVDTLQLPKPPAGARLLLGPRG